MRFNLSITLGNDAMKDQRDVARTLRDVADRIELEAGDAPIHDDNGNKCGRWSFTRGNRK